MTRNCLLFLLTLFPLLGLAQQAEVLSRKASGNVANQPYTVATHRLTQEAAKEIALRAKFAAKDAHKEITIAVLDASGQTILILRGDGVGPHNTEAARRKAYTSVSTKTPTLELARKAKANPDSENLANLPELLLLGGGYPLWYNGEVIGSIGVAGGGGPEMDDRFAKAGAIKEAGITTN